jgi:hypothetical protein
MRILVTSASGANGNGYGAILGSGPDGEFTGPFSSDPRITDPRGLSLDPSGALVYQERLSFRPYDGPQRTPPAAGLNRRPRPGPAVSQIPRPVKISDVGGSPYAPGHE